MAQIAIYVQRRYAKPTYSTESYSARRWYGIEMIRDVLERAGFEVDFCSASNVGDYKVVLVGLTGSVDYFTYGAERETWPPGDYTCIVGGAGLLNVQPFVWTAGAGGRSWGDVWCFGRAEGFIVELVKASIKGERFEHPSVCYADQFDPDGSYEICQAAELYPHQITIADGQEWQEGAIGCKRKCWFCAFSWHRKPMISPEERDGNFLVGIYGVTQETTIPDLMSMPVQEWSVRLQLGLDGISERLRMGVNKRISDEMWHGLVRKLIERENKGWARIYNITGYPSETEDDLREFIDGLERVADKAKTNGEAAVLTIHSTPFKPMPATPSACWPFCYESRREWMPKTAQRMYPRKTYENRLSIVFRPNLRVQGGPKEEGLAAIMLEAIAMRSTVDDTDSFRKICRTSKFWSAPAAGKIATLEQVFDMHKLMGEFTPETIPTRYLRTWVRPGRLYKDWRKCMLS
jgi:hypothetical protein